MQRHDGHARPDDLAHPGEVEICEADVPDDAFAAQLVEPGRGVDVAGHTVVPPVQLNEVDGLHAQPGARPLHDGPHVRPRERRQLVPIGHALGVHAHAGRGGAAIATEAGEEASDERLDARVDVGAIEGRDAGIDERSHVVERRLLVDRTVAAGELPAALQQARDLIPGREARTRDRRARHGRGGSGTAVTSP
ncbi:MAG: hypothetical protein R2712_15680 [Vicinamibacterales bacterium]